MPSPAPARDAKHEALEAFLGTWTAVGTSFGGTDQSGTDPRANGQPWASSHRGYWHTGRFFLIQDERTVIGDAPFDTVSIMGVDPHTGDYFARAFENHGYYRDYPVVRDGALWRIEGETERATIEFRDDDRTQVIQWEWKPEKVWLPLCDRTAKRSD